MGKLSPPQQQWGRWVSEPHRSWGVWQIAEEGQGGAVSRATYLMQRQPPWSLSWQYGRAKQTYLLACKNSASCLTWLGVGIACYRVSAITFKSSAL